MDHRSRLRGTGPSRIPRSQYRPPRAPLSFHVEQEAREGEEWERQQLRQRTPANGVSESEDLPDSVMAGAVRGWEAEERPRTREEECHFYAGGQVYPGETSRVSAADHSLHLSKAKISKPAPYWEGTAVINGEFQELKLTDYHGKYLVFFFYPLDFTFVCPTEIIAFGDRIEEFRSINTEVVACSVDSQFTHLAWINTPRRQGGLGPIKIPLLSDLNHQISKDYGVYLEDSGHTLRGLFIIDDKGILRQITLNDLPVGRSVDETLRLVQAFQYTDRHGEVCPAGWKPGSETIKPQDVMKAWWPREDL
ncbi:peroxiredoxin-4 isoform X3 [Suricata suricatta]|uniref:peroxiredoxin-4 isoform X2 n=1 Tax=Suricata suricatta TaxID=37032 RepID=UPI001155B830|nr:peroxiredoxin-4 isoform X2 [Suricata suricatta]XP_029785895.1 peroxiredoxin-4 isoform X3 [Suricata suricatta]